MGKFINHTAPAKIFHVCLLQACSLLKFLFMAENNSNTCTLDFLPYLLEMLPWLFFHLKQFSFLCYFHWRTHTRFRKISSRFNENLSPTTFYLQFLAEISPGIFLTCALQENVNSLAQSLKVLKLALLPKEHPQQCGALGTSKAV